MERWRWCVGGSTGILAAEQLGFFRRAATPFATESPLFYLVTRKKGGMAANQFTAPKQVLVCSAWRRERRESVCHRSWIAHGPGDKKPISPSCYGNQPIFQGGSGGSLAHWGRNPPSIPPLIPLKSRCFKGLDSTRVD